MDIKSNYNRSNIYEFTGLVSLTNFHRDTLQYHLPLQLLLYIKLIYFHI